MSNPNDYWKVGMMVRVVRSIDKSLINQFGFIKEVTKQSPRGTQLVGTDWYPKTEILVSFPDIPASSRGTTMANITSRMSAAQVSKVVETALDSCYEKIFRAEHLAPATTMDRLLYG